MGHNMPTSDINFESLETPLIIRWKYCKCSCKAVAKFVYYLSHICSSVRTTQHDFHRTHCSNTLWNPSLKIGQNSGISAKNRYKEETISRVTYV